MSVRTREKNFQEVVDELEMESAGEVHLFELEALEGNLEEGIYVLDVSNVETDMSYPEDREVPGVDAPHSEKDIISIAYVGETSISDARQELEKYLESEHDSEEFLTPEDWEESYGVTLRDSRDAVMSRACYFCD